MLTYENVCMYAFSGKREENWLTIRSGKSQLQWIFLLLQLLHQQPNIVVVNLLFAHTVCNLVCSLSSIATKVISALEKHHFRDDSIDNEASPIRICIRKQYMK